MPYLILFGNSWNQCSVDTAVIHLQRWVAPKDHSQFFHHVDAPPVPSSHLKPQPPCKEMNSSPPPIIWVILASNIVILKHEALFKKILVPLVFISCFFHPNISPVFNSIVEHSIEWGTYTRTDGKLNCLQKPRQELKFFYILKKIPNVSRPSLLLMLVILQVWKAMQCGNNANQGSAMTQSSMIETAHHIRETWELTFFRLDSTQVESSQ